MFTSERSLEFTTGKWDTKGRLPFFRKRIWFGCITFSGNGHFSSRGPSRSVLSQAPQNFYNRCTVGSACAKIKTMDTANISDMAWGRYSLLFLSYCSLSSIATTFSLRSFEIFTKMSQKGVQRKLPLQRGIYLTTHFVLFLVVLLGFIVLRCSSTRHCV